MSDLPLNPTEERDALAGELALRVLSPEEEAVALARLETDAGFADEVEAWNEHLAAFVAEVVPVKPSPEVWPRVEAGIGAGVTTGPIVPVAANDDGKIAFWRTWAVASTGLMAASLVGLAIMLGQPPREVIREVPGPAAQGGMTRVATLTLEDGAPAVTLAYDTATGNLFIAPTMQLAGDTRVPHLWLVRPEGGVQLVGAIDGSTTSRQSLPDALSGVAGSATAVAISLEAPGTTPASDTPGGPVVASGELQQL